MLSIRTFPFTPHGYLNNLILEVLVSCIIRGGTERYKALTLKALCILTLDICRFIGDFPGYNNRVTDVSEPSAGFWACTLLSLIGTNIELHDYSYRTAV